MQKKLSIVRLLLLFIFITGVASAQTPAPGINNLIARINTYNSTMPVEKVFLHFDKPYYAAGDTIWFKGYLMSQAIGYSSLSSRLYVELLNDSNAVVKRFVFPAALGLTWGALPLSRAYVHDGTYTIRAYTNWMRNFGEDYFFKQSFYINSPGDNTWLVNVQSAMAATGNRDDVKLALKFTGLDGKTAANSLNFKVINNKKVLLRNTVQSGSDGVVNVDFTLPAQTNLKNLNVVVQDKADNTRTALIPVNVNRPQDVDLQFMPESGPLVAGIPAHVGFKAVGEDGKGIAITGTIFDNDHNEIAQLNTLRYGMGTFDMAPLADKTYTAEINLPGGGKKMVALPQLLKTGSVISVRNSMDRDSIPVSVYNTAAVAGAKYYLVGMSRGVVCYGAAFSFGGNRFAARVAKSLFPTGVAHFILLNPAQQPLNERITYIDQDDALKIDIKTGESSFAARDSIPVHITVKDAAGNPVIGSFSLAVTDDNQVKSEKVMANNIMSHLLLAADLKGYVEDAPYYMQHTPEAWKALDALMLSQGWVGYDLAKISQPAKPLYDPEVEFTVKGTVNSLFNKPISNAKVILLAKGDQNFVKDTLSDKQGQFVFDHFPRINKSTFAISAHNASGKIINGGIKVDEKNQAPVTTGTPILLDPWNINADPQVLNYVKSNRDYHATLDKEQYGPNGSRLLKAVTVKDQATVRNSQNLNGAGLSDQVLTEDVMVNAGKQSLLDVLMSKVKNFHQSFYKDSNQKTNIEYFIRDKRVRFVFDGIDVDRFYQPVGGQANEHFDYQKQYLDYVSAEDVLGVEVVYTRNARYNAENLTNTDDLLAADAAGPRGADNAYLEITTRSGTGPFIQRATSIYIYKPLPLAEYKAFYRPRYPVKKIIDNTDIRSTIHWMPNIITDKNGMSTVSFYAADKLAKYTIICEGSDMNGKVGVQTGSITIAK